MAWKGSFYTYQNPHWQLTPVPHLAGVPSNGKHGVSKALGWWTPQDPLLFLLLSDFFSVDNFTKWHILRKQSQR
jgi:hypothetical protein